VLHAVLAVYTVCFAGGVTLIIVSFFSARRFSLPGFRDFALLFSAATLILIVEALKTYERAVASDFGAGLHLTGAVLGIAGNAGMTWYLLSLPLKVITVDPSLARVRLNVILAAGVGVLGGLRELVPVLWPSSGLELLFWNADYLALLGIHVTAAVILLSGFSRIENTWMRSIIRSFLILLGVFAPLAVAQLVVQDLPTAPDVFHDFPVNQLVYYMGFVILALVYVARFFAEPVGGPVFTLPEGFIRKFGISHREGDIIEMMAKGFSNSAIAEKLYISTLTVKNHVYHIYQKTGAENKVQLLNMINSSK
jgi:DNA-binding CsgD family transcriptional regulator